MSEKHELVDGTLYVDRDESGKAKGIIGRCTCGWTTGYRISSASASVAFMDHQERRAAGKSGDYEY